MKKRFSFVLFSLLIMAFCVSDVPVASAAMKNLFSEFRKAIEIFTYDEMYRDDDYYYGDVGRYYSYGPGEHVKGLNPSINYEERLNQIDVLIKQGLHVQDTIRGVCILSLGISRYAGRANKEAFNQAEAFCVALIKKLAKSKADFKEVFSNELLGKEEYGQRPANNLTSNLLRAFLDAGAEPHYYLLHDVFKDSPYRYQDDKWNDKKAELSLEKAKILIEHKVRFVNLGWFGLPTSSDSAMAEFLKNIYLFPSEKFTKEDEKNHFEYISKMLELLRNAGADTKEAKEYLSKLRKQYRNTPEALKQIDRIEKLTEKSSFCSLGNAGLLTYGILFLSVLMTKKRGRYLFLRNKRKGFSLAELITVIIVIAIIAGIISWIFGR